MQGCVKIFIISFITLKLELEFLIFRIKRITGGFNRYNKIFLRLIMN